MSVCVPRTSNGKVKTCTRNTWGQSKIHAHVRPPWYKRNVVSRSKHNVDKSHKSTRLALSAVSVTDTDVKDFEALTSKEIGEEVRTLERQRDRTFKKRNGNVRFSD